MAHTHDNAAPHTTYCTLVLPQKLQWDIFGFFLYTSRNFQISRQSVFFKVLNNADAYHTLGPIRDRKFLPYRNTKVYPWYGEYAEKWFNSCCICFNRYFHISVFYLFTVLGKLTFSISHLINIIFDEYWFYISLVKLFWSLYKIWFFALWECFFFKVLKYIRNI